MEARKRFGELLEQVHYRGDEVVIERAGKPMGVLISAERYESLEATRRDAFQELLEMAWANSDLVPLTDEEAMEIAVREVKAVRAEQAAARA
jgi:prevent-host-death family protein